MTTRLDFELTRAAQTVVKDLGCVKPGENVAITADTISDERVIEAVAGAVFAAGALPLVLRYPTPDGVGKAADKDIPYKAIGAAIGNCDVWLEFGCNWILYSSAQEIALSINKDLRHVCLTGTDTDMMYRLIGNVDFTTLAEFQEKVLNMTKAAKHVKVTSPGGTDVEFENDPETPYYNEMGIADKPGSAYLAGQICWFPKNETINGVIAFDGSITPPCGVVSEPVLLHVEKGYVKKVTGGHHAEQFANWLASFKDPLMYRMAHICYGFHPNAKLCGNCVEDERIWGSTEWGLGYLPAADAPPDGIDAASHSDGITLNSSVWLDGVQLLDQGKVVYPDLVELAKKITG